MKKISVLLVDDNPCFLRAASKFLEEQMEISVVGLIERGILGLEQACTHRPQIILLDLAMPDLPGLKMIPHLRTQASSVGIIVLSMMDTVPYRETALALGADDFVSKRTIYDDLLPAIRRVVKVWIPRGRSGRGRKREMTR
jgi:DNA-binding NarL/FixJ family response regulator